MAEQPFHHDNERQIVIIDGRHTISDETLVKFAIQSGLVEAPKLEPIGDMIGEALGNIVIDSSSTACTNRPSCPCTKCQTRLNKLLRDHQTRMKNANSPLNRAERRAAKKLKKRR